MTYKLSELTPMKNHWLLRNSNIPRRFIGMEPEDILDRTGEFPDAIESWLEKVLAGKVIKEIGGLGTTGTGLLFDGGPGLGKTTHAVTTLMEFIRRLPDDVESARAILAMSSENYGMQARPIYYMTFPEFLSRKKAMFDADPETKKNLFLEMEGFHGRLSVSEDHLNVRILVLDDLGKEYGSKYDDTSFDEILRARYDKALPTIITTNVNRENWEKQYGEAMGSFAHEAFKRVRIIGKDLRKN
jgi:DNA replication protein DnaC